MVPGRGQTDLKETGDEDSKSYMLNRLLSHHLGVFVGVTVSSVDRNSERKHPTDVVDEGQYLLWCLGVLIPGPRVDLLFRRIRETGNYGELLPHPLLMFHQLLILLDSSQAVGSLSNPWLK